MKNKLDKIFDFLFWNILVLWPMWFLVLYVIFNAITKGI